MKIWALFSVDNQYDQPDHNLAAWWPEKPNIETMAAAIQGREDLLKVEFPCRNDEDTVATVSIWAGGEHQMQDGTRYRLEQIEPGIPPKRK